MARRHPGFALMLATLLLNACGHSDMPWSRDDTSTDDAVAAPTKADAKPPAKIATAPLPGQNSRLEDIESDLGAVANLDELIKNLNLGAYHRCGYTGQGVKIAVLDNGFTGLNRSLGQRLPPGLKVEKGNGPDMADTTHGTKLAEIAYALATGKAAYDSEIKGPEILLYNAKGFTNLKAAIDAVITQKVDIVLYAQVWEYGGNGDSSGFINAAVDRATAAGVLWVNAAGNFGQSTFAGPISIDSDGQAVKLPHQERYVRFAVPQHNTPVRVVLSWNDFDTSETYRTAQDLDLFLLDENGKELASSRMAQTGSASTKSEDGRELSAHAREIVQTQLSTGTYMLRVDARSANFDAASRLRLTVDGLNVRVIERTEEETVLIPADNATVFTVGASDVSYSSRSFGTNVRPPKPDAVLKSTIKFDDGMEVQGTSAATAIAVGALAVFQSQHGSFNQTEALRLLHADVLGRASADGMSMELRPATPRCRAKRR